MPRKPRKALPLSKALASYSQSPVAALLAAPPLPGLSQDEKERHRIYCYLLLSLLAHYWTPKEYESARRQGPGTKERIQSRYLGHNIACLAVTERGEIVDFDFNHNEIFNSSLEHAEARLLRRLFSLTHHFYSDAYFALPRLSGQGLFVDIANFGMQFIEDVETRYRIEKSHYSQVLRNITIYTSLESCAQCSGMMALGAVSQVVYLQHDPGQNLIGNILFNLNEGSAFKAPRPIAADALGLSEYRELELAYIRFCSKAPKGKKPATRTQQQRTPSITSFLASRIARGIFRRAQKKFKQLTVSNTLFKPKTPRSTLTNKEVLVHALKFERLATMQGRRGTPSSR